MRALEPGELRHTVVIEYDAGAGAATDAWADPIEDWQEFATVRASVHPISSYEVLEADRVSSDATHRMRMWYWASLTTDMRCKIGTDVYEILAIRNPWLTHKELLLELKIRDKDS